MKGSSEKSAEVQKSKEQKRKRIRGFFAVANPPDISGKNKDRVQKNQKSRFLKMNYGISILYAYNIFVKNRLVKYRNMCNNLIILHKITQFCATQIFLLIYEKHRIGS
jgi:hypothetical protein